MRVRSSQWALLALPHLAAAVTLSDFLPRLENLSPACDAIYMSMVSGCQGSDFADGANCSVACIGGLQEITDAVKAACGNQNLEGSNVITAYLANQGPQTLCSNAQAVLAAESSSSAAVASTSSTPDATSALPSSTTTTTTTSSSSSSLASSATTSSTSSTSTSTSASGLSNSAAVSLTPATSSTTAAKPAQSSADDGTRGSDPFNTQDGSNGGSTISATLSVGMLTIGMLVLALR